MANSHAMVLDEKFDVLVSRPVANRLARLLYRMGLSADQTSMIAAALGVSAGVLITGPGLWPMLGGLLLVGMVIADCADGAVARLGPPSDRPWRGRIFDGIADLSTVLAVHIGMAVALSHANIVVGGYALGKLEIIALAVAGFFSFSWKSSVLDDVKQRLKPASVDRDLEKYRDQKKSLFERFVFWLLVWYVKNSEKLTGAGRPGGYDLFRHVALIGPTHHLVAIAVAAALAPLAPTVFLSYFLLTIGPGNLYLWYILARARRDHAEAEA